MSIPPTITNFNGRLMFSGNYADGFELWQSDGTYQGTFQAPEILPGRSSSYPMNLQTVLGKLFFTADDRLRGRELWTVAEINTAPVFVPGVQQDVTDESGPQMLFGWGIVAPGPPDENLQALTIEIQTTNLELFSEAPRLERPGTLIYTPKPNVKGSAVVTVKLTDNAGTANGGVDTLAPQTFTINIDKPHPWHNSALPLDVNGDGHVAANDSLDVINYLNAFGPGPVPADGATDDAFFDVTGDNSVAPRDALEIINAINAGMAGEGEAIADCRLQIADWAASAECVTQRVPGSAEWELSGMEELVVMLAGEAGRRRFWIADCRLQIADFGLQILGLPRREAREVCSEAGD